jgi:anti-sigma B factor antagonist
MTSIDGRAEDHFAVRQYCDGDATVVEVSGCVDMITAPQLASQLDMAVDDRPSVLVADLTGVTLLSSAAIETLVEVQRLSAAIGTSVRVVGRAHHTVRPIQVLGLDRTLPLYPTVCDALSEPLSAT